MEGWKMEEAQAQAQGEASKEREEEKGAKVALGTDFQHTTPCNGSATHKAYHRATAIATFSSLYLFCLSFYSPSNTHPLNQPLTQPLTHKHTSMAVTLKYFALRGRGEPIRLALVASGAEWTEEGVDYAAMKAGAGTADYPFGQVPILVDGSLVLSQMDAIVRHIGRTRNLYGSSNAEAAQIDVVLLGVESQRSAYGDLIYKAALADEAKQTYATTHIDRQSVAARNGGAHFAYLEAILSRNNAGAAFVVGDALSIADLAV
jgi:glutathione S-transferase